MAQATALGVRRFFTTDGTHPYDELTWTKQDAKIDNPVTGEIAFEQKGVEFPDSWSLNAVNIVSQKYFSGTPGTKGRESSVRQLIDRVADTITRHGEQEGYFDSKKEAQIFNEELKAILVNQRAAFNSPVWFNIGVPERRQQASACFILEVEDNMTSILNWYYEEGMIFKGGSGAGINLSSLRSSYEGLGKSSGKASGPVSFMRGADASAGTIKSGGKTRRAAKMVMLDIDHPDVEEFIWCKAIEERKARVLQRAGYDMGVTGDHAFSIQYQNANNSVRVSDEFMEAATSGKQWGLRAVTDGEVVKTVDAKKLLNDVALAAWECADPGMQYDTTINDWHTTPNFGPIKGSNPCSEYMHVNNSACNLASINLLKYLDEDGSFDVEGYTQTIEIMFMAQEILVGYSQYPTEMIDKNTRALRQLGLGYANLGALLMAKGMAYDSDEGRAFAAALTALMTGHGYATSAKMAKRVGPFSAYSKDRKNVISILKKHRDALKDVDAAEVPENLYSAAAEAWDAAVEGAEKHGVRNAQATVLAPTGTISFMMDCDTTGIEPDLGLVKFKKLVGGGMMSIVNQTIPRALKKLGYNTKQIQDIVEYIDEDKTIIDAPHLSKDHYEIFACSMGDNTIHYNGHIMMMGAVQPFISGAISKTVNMPEDVSVEDVEQLFIDSWKLGIKAVAIYRDNCKVDQPLSTAEKEGDEDESPAEAAAAPVAAAAAASAATTASSTGYTVSAPIKRELPKVRTSKTYEFKVADLKGYFTVGEFEDGTPGELWLNIAKQGSTLAGIMDSFAKAVSYGLQYGVPLKTYAKGLVNMNFAPSGITDDKEIKTASSLVDYVFRRLAKDYMSIEDQMELGLASLDDFEAAQTSLDMDTDSKDFSSAQTAINTSPATTESEPAVTIETMNIGDPEPVVEEIEEPVVIDMNKKLPPAEVAESTAPLCMECGNQTIRAGACYVCPACGSSTGCG